MKKRRSRFRTGYLIFTILLLLIAAGLVTALWVFLDGYQRRYEEREQMRSLEQERLRLETAEARAPQLALEAFLRTADADWWTSAWFRQHPEDPEPPDAVRAVLEGLLSSSDLKVWKDESWSETAPVYIMKSGGDPFARIWLEGAGTEWSVADASLLLVPENAAQTETLAACRVAWADTEPEQLGETYSRFPLSGYSLSDPVLWKTVGISGVLAEPELTVYPPAGAELAFSETDGFTVLLFDGDDAQRCMDTAVEFVRAILRYYMSGEKDTRNNMNRCLAYVQRGSAAWDTLKASYDGITWNYSYKDQNVDDVSADRPIRWSANCVSVDVHFHARASKDGQMIDYAVGSYRIYFFDYGKGFVITELVFG